MGQEDVVEPPKKKLKQAQLSFCSTPINGKSKGGQKRKLNDETNGLQNSKIICRENNVEEGDLKKNKILNCETISLVDDTDNSTDARVTTVKNVNKDNKPNINKTDSVPIEEEKENLNSEKETRKSIHEEASLHLALDIDSIQPDAKAENSTSGSSSDHSVDQSPKENEISKMDISCNSLNTSKDDGENDLKDEEDNKETSFTTDTSLKSDSDTDSDNAANVEQTTPTSKDGQNAVTPKRQLTPKQLLRKAESEKKKLERERIKQEKLQEKAKVREERLQKLAEKKDERKRLKEEKEKKRQVEIMQKNEEKRLKDEEKKKKEEAKEEEKKRKEEAKLLEQKKESQARAAFASFFVPRKSTSSSEKIDDLEEEAAGTNFMPFRVKQDMRLADVLRSVLSQESRATLDSLCTDTYRESNELYLQELKQGKHVPKSSEATWPLSAWQEEQHDVIIIESVGNEVSLDEHDKGSQAKVKCHKAKLIQFHDNRRPPYWGTWRKRSKTVTPRKPLCKDSEFFDYEVDSDSEWEDEEEGESLEGGDDADKEQEGDEEEGDGENGYLLDKTFVPHGYLSDEEAQAKDEDISPEEQKLRMILLKEEFDEEMNQKAERLKPRLLGCVWINNETTEVSSGSLYERLFLYRTVWDQAAGTIDLSAFDESESPSSASSAPKVKPFPSSAVEPLVKLVHGSLLPLSQLVNEFLKQLEKDCPTQCITKRAVTRKIKDIAKRSYDSNGKQAWSVNADFCSEFGLKGLSGIKTPISVGSSPATPASEKPKKTMLDSFLKGETPQNSQKKQMIKKRVQLTTLSKSPLPVIDLTSAEEQTEPDSKQNNPVVKETPKQEVVKKRVPLITLSTTPKVSKPNQTVHQDTPRPAVNPFSRFMKSTPTENSETMKEDKNEK